MKIKQTYQPTQVKYIISTLVLIGVILLIFNGISPPQEKSRKYLPNSSKEDIAFLSKKSTLLEVLTYFRKHKIYFSVKDEASQKMASMIRDSLLKLGGEEISKLGFRESYVGYMEKGLMKREKRSAKNKVELQIEKVTIESGGSQMGNFSHLVFQNKTLQGYKRGLHIYIPNEANEEVFHYRFDFYKEANPAVPGSILNEKDEGNNRIEIVLDQKIYKQLESKRNEALKRKVLLTSAEDFVPAKIIFGEQSYDATVRLKGDWTDHLGHNKWSFRVKIEGGETLLGMRKFSLHHPKARNYLGEWIFHQMLKKEDILNLQYDFLNVQMTVKNGMAKQSTDWGMYALEESFDKYLLERNHRREGVILKIDEGPMWEERLKYLDAGLDLHGVPGTIFGKYDELPILPFNEKKVLRDSSLYQQFIAGRNLLDAFLKKEIHLSEAFDVETMAKFNALCNLLGASHALNLHNIRVYYNPITQKLEPIGFDGIAWQKTHWTKIFYEGKNDLVFMRAYGKALDRMRQKSYVDAILQMSNLNQKWLKVQRAFPEYYFDDKLLTANRNTLRHMLSPSHCMNIFFQNISGIRMEVMVEHFGQFPSQIQGLSIQNNRIIALPEHETIIQPGQKQKVVFLLDKNFKKLFVSKKSKKANFEIDKDLEKIKVLYSALGTSKDLTENILPWSARNQAFENTAPYKKKPNHKDFEFLSTDEEAKTITWKSGIWELQEALIIPPGYHFKIQAGTKIRIEKFQKHIISHSPVFFEGTAQSPIEITSNSGDGEGLFVLETIDTSLINHTIFDGLRNVTSHGWHLTGSVNFYNAPVKIHNSQISNNHSEDALNIIRSWFELDNITISETQSDAFDGDFVSGIVRNSIFGNLGNDGIDVSGSDVKIENVKIVSAGDKGLSGGEASIMKIKNIEIVDSEIALASKDQSELIVEKAILKNNKLGFTAYQKKPEFGFAHILANEVEMKGNETDYLIENNSSLNLNGKIVKTSARVLERMYGSEFGKASQ